MQVPREWYCTLNLPLETIYTWAAHESPHACAVRRLDIGNIIEGECLAFLASGSDPTVII